MKNNLKTRQQKRAEKRRARRARNIFETGLESLEVPREALHVKFTTTESLVYQTMLLHSDRKTRRIARAKVDNYMEWTGTKSRTSIYSAIKGLNEKGVIEAEVDGWVTGTVLLRYENQTQKASEDQVEMDLPKPLNRALVHRQALKLMSDTRLPALAQKLYWKLAMEIDLQTGKMHFQKIQILADFFEVGKASIYKSLRQIRAAGLGSIEVDYGVDGHLEHVALAYNVIQLAVEKKREMASTGINKRTAAQKYEQFRTALYRLFGVPIEALSTGEIQQGIDALYEKLEPVVKSMEIPDGEIPDGCTDWEKVLGFEEPLPT